LDYNIGVHNFKCDKPLYHSVPKSTECIMGLRNGFGECIFQYASFGLHLISMARHIPLQDCVIARLKVIVNHQQFTMRNI